MKQVLQQLMCLNPCCNGKCSWRAAKKAAALWNVAVSILVVMENALGEGI